MLAQIERCPHPAQLAEALLLPAPTVSFIVRQLEKLKLITRKMDPTDLRRYTLTLTRKGKNAVQAGKTVLGEVAGKRIDRLSAADQRRLKALLSSLKAARE